MKKRPKKKKRKCIADVTTTSINERMNNVWTMC